MRTRRRAPRTDLRQAVESLPRQTRIAMLQGIATNPIIAGAYATGDGVCPVLAAHRAGGRTSVIAFAQAWDRFAFRDTRQGRARRATERELLVLRSNLEASLLDEDAPETDLAAAAREHAALKRRREPEPATEPGRATASPATPTRTRPGDPDRSTELGGRPGWAWTRLVRRYDDYEQVLARLESERAVAESVVAESAVAESAAAVSPV